MKKTILMAVLVLCAGLCFAQEGEAAQSENAQTTSVQPADVETDNTQTTDAQTVNTEKFNMEVTVGVSVHSGNSPSPHEFAGNSTAMDKTVTADTMLGFAMTFPLHQFVGLTLDADFFFGNEKITQSASQSSSISFFGTNVLFGPIFYLYKYYTFRIPLAVGAHIYYWDSNAWISTLNAANASGTGWLRNNDLQVGVGMSVGIHFYFTHNAYMISRANVDMDFFRWHKTRLFNGTNVADESEAELAIGWGIRPTIGLGMRF
ncbi:MAG: hypothetical protein LBG95_03820 [Treponema sp.]|jgi:uncharacterized protein YdeI (BOF family)|nr:hypothetical protein [Treponema sp.]